MENISPWLATATMLYDLQQKRKNIEQEEAELKERLKLLSDYKTKSEGNFVFVKEIRTGSVDYSKISILKSINLDQYRRPSVESWKLICSKDECIRPCCP